MMWSSAFHLVHLFLNLALADIGRRRSDAGRWPPWQNSAMHRFSQVARAERRRLTRPRRPGRARALIQSVLRPHAVKRRLSSEGHGHARTGKCGGIRHGSSASRQQTVTKDMDRVEEVLLRFAPAERSSVCSAARWKRMPGRRGAGSPRRCAAPSERASPENYCEVESVA